MENRQRVLDIIKKELGDIRDKYGDDRRSKIEAGATDGMEITAKDLTPNEPMIVFITKQDYIKRIHQRPSSVSVATPAASLVRNEG